MDPRIEQLANEIAAQGNAAQEKTDWFKSKSDEERALVRYTPEGAMAGAARLIEAIDERNVGYLCSRLHTANTASRRAFERITGISLGRNSDSMLAGVRKYVGEEAYQAYIAKGEADRLAAEAARQKAEADRKAAESDAIIAKMKASQEISGDELLVLVRHFEIAIHPRTAGTIRKRIVAIRHASLSARGKGSIPCTVWEAYQAVEARIALQPV